MVLSDHSSDSQVGGFPYTVKWPKHGGEKLTPLLCLGPQLLSAAGIAIQKTQCLSVFAKTSAPRELVIHDQPKKKDLAALPAAVLLHERTDRPNVDRKAPTLPWPSPCGLRVGEEQDDLVESERSGLCISKIAGTPGWLQDPIELPGLTSVLQISAKTLIMAGAQDDPLRGGVAYLFLDRAAPGKGVFFSQFT